MTTERDVATAQAQSTEANREVYTVERRRPGRIEEVRSELISLFREPTGNPTDNLTLNDATEDGCNPARGIVTCVLLGGLLWTDLFFVAKFFWDLVRWLLR